MASQRERELYARCAEPQTEEIFHGILRWTPSIGYPDFDRTSPLVQTLGEHHASFSGHKHGNFALFLNEQLSLSPPDLNTKTNTELANVRRLFPLSIGVMTVARWHDAEGNYIGYRVYGDLQRQIK